MNKMVRITQIPQMQFSTEYTPNAAENARKTKIEAIVMATDTEIYSADVFITLNF